jgi:hypothetical protein
VNGGFGATASARDRAAVERLGAVAIDYRNEDFLARVRELTDDGVDVVLDSLGGALSLRSFRALRPGGRLVVFGRYATLSHGRKNWPAVIEWYAATATVWLWGKLSPRRRALSYQIQKFRDLREYKIHPVVAELLPLSDARRAHELLERTAATGKLVLGHKPTRTLTDGAMSVPSASRHESESVALVRQLGVLPRRSVRHRERRSGPPLSREARAHRGFAAGYPWNMSSEERIAGSRR